MKDWSRWINCGLRCIKNEGDRYSSAFPMQAGTSHHLRLQEVLSGRSSVERSMAVNGVTTMIDEEWELVAAAEKWEAINQERVDAARKLQRAAWKKMFGDDSELTDDTLSAGDGEPEEDTSESACWDRLMDEAAKEHMECPNYFKWRTWVLEDNRTIHTVDYCFNDEDLYDDYPPEPIQ